MNKLVKKLLLFLLFLCVGTLSSLKAEKGIVVAVNDYFAKEFFFGSLAHLRNNLHCDLPIEVYYIGSELSESTIERLSEFPPITFCDITQIPDVDPRRYSGWHIKGILFKLTSFDEALMMDADVYFFQNPELLFDHPGYQQCGVYLFRDRALFDYRNPFFYGKPGDDNHNLKFYQKKRDFFLSLVPNSPSLYMPEEWRFYWEDIESPLTSGLTSEHIDAGCVLLNRETHKNSIERIVELNGDVDIRKLIGQYLYGDKETYWLACEMAQEPYFVNPELPCELFCLGKSIHNLYQFLDGTLFYQQRSPQFVFPNAHFVPYGNPRIVRPINQEECEMMNSAAVISKKIKFANFTNPIS